MHGLVGGVSVCYRRVHGRVENHNSRIVFISASNCNVLPLVRGVVYREARENRAGVRLVLDLYRMSSLRFTRIIWSID